MNPPRYTLFLFPFIIFLFLHNFVSAPVFDAKDYPILPTFIVKPEPKTILFLGDIMLGRYVEKMMTEKGEEYPFENMKFLLDSSTHVVANLEGVIPSKHVPTPSNGFFFSFKESVAPLLSRMNISAVSLANNHSYNFGQKGWLNTKNRLSSSSVISFGYSETSLDDVYEVNLDGQMVTIFGINMISDNWDIKKAIEATEKVRKSHPDSYLIAFLHWGNEYKHNQSWSQREFAHALVDSGVSAVIGAHPHVVQGIELYKDKPIFYSLGNFIFDQYFSVDVQDGYVLKMKIVDNQINYQIIPYTSTLSQPKVADEFNGKRILEIIARESDLQIRDKVKNGTLNLSK